MPARTFEDKMLKHVEGDRERMSDDSGENTVYKRIVRVEKGQKDMSAHDTSKVLSENTRAREDDASVVGENCVR